MKANAQIQVDVSIVKKEEKPKNDTQKKSK